MSSIVRSGCWLGGEAASSSVCVAHRVALTVDFSQIWRLFWEEPCSVEPLWRIDKRKLSGKTRFPKKEIFVLSCW